jgi:hypothetical protein
MASPFAARDINAEKIQVGDLEQTDEGEVHDLIRRLKRSSVDSTAQGDLNSSPPDINVALIDIQT